MNREYFISAGDSQEGPFSFDILKRKKIKTNTNVWYDGLDDWTKVVLFQTDELKGLFKNNINSNYDVEKHNNKNSS